MHRIVARASILWLSIALSVPAVAARTDAMAASEIKALQQRLADAKCYGGSIDGIASLALDRAIGACPTQAPQLRIETGMHVAPVWRVGVDALCRFAATGSDDKTVRLWSLPEGRLVRTMRVPIGAGNEGKAFAVAMSPDGRLIAAGGWAAQRVASDGHTVTFFDAESGAVAARVGGFGNVLHYLSFSPDGRWLAAASEAGVGVKVIDVQNRSIVASDAAYRGPVYGTSFGPDGRLYTVAYDGKLRRYGVGPTFRKEQEIETRGGKQPASVSVDPRGELLAVGFDDTARIDVYDAATLQFRYAADTREVGNGTLRSVTWRRDGEGFMAGGKFSYRFNVGWRTALVTFDRAGRRVGPLHALANSTLFDIQPCGNGAAASAADPGFGTVDARGQTTLWRRSVASDVREMGQVFAVSADARQVRFALSVSGRDPVRFDLGEATLNDAPAPVAGLSPPDTVGLPVANWNNVTNPTFAGKPIPLEAYEAAESVAVRSDRGGFVLGTNFYVRAYDATGKLRWQKPVPGSAWDVNVTKDGRIVTVAYRDGTVRWHRWSDGAELLALFVNRDTKAWVAWTPSGYYMASPGGEDMIGWHLNRGWDQAADFFPGSRFRERFSRFDIVKLVLETLDEAKAVEQANASGKRRADVRPIIERLPPVLTIVSPTEGSSVAPGQTEITFAVRSPSGARVDRVEVFVDGAKVDSRGQTRLNTEATADSAATTLGTVVVPMPAHDTAISLVAYAGELAGDPVRVQLKGQQLASEPSADDALKPTLYALLVGVSHYDNASYDLGYAAADAAGFAQALKAQKGKLFKDVQVRVLTDKQASSVGLRKGLTWLKKQTTAHDLAIVFAAGHGITDDEGRFWFLTADADPEELLATAISRDDIAGTLYGLPGKKLLFLDACHSGAAIQGGGGKRGLSRADINSAVNDFASSEGGVVAYAASTGREFSVERPEWGHGAFTKALIEAIGEGKADLLHNGTITTATLDAFVSERVKQLTGGHQHALMTRPKTVPDFPVAITGK